jgi:hypothetical protein
MNTEHAMSRHEWRDFRLSTRNAGYWPGIREGGTPLNRRRPVHQRLLWKLSRHIPLDDLSLTSPLIALSVLCLTGALLALLFGFPWVALVLGCTMLASLICHFRRHAAPRVAPAFKRRAPRE